VVLFAYSLSVIQGLPEYKAVRETIARLWDRSIRMSSLAHGLAGQIAGVSKDSAILAGLLHAMGKIFLVARAAWYAPILEDPAALDHVLSAWHARVGKALLTEWDFDANIISAVTRYEMSGQGDSPATSAPEQRLTDVLALAHALVDLPQGEDTSDPWDAVLQQSLAARRLGLAAVDAKGLRQRVAREVEQMRGVLS
jgi:HD-like signal output (HDOD) protein